MFRRNAVTIGDLWTCSSATRRWSGAVLLQQQTFGRTQCNMRARDLVVAVEIRRNPDGGACELVIFDGHVRSAEVQQYHPTFGAMLSHIAEHVFTGGNRKRH